MKSFKLIILLGAFFLSACSKKMPEVTNEIIKTTIAEMEEEDGIFNAMVTKNERLYGLALITLDTNMSQDKAKELCTQFLIKATSNFGEEMENNYTVQETYFDYGVLLMFSQNDKILVQGDKKGNSEEIIWRD